MILFNCSRPSSQSSSPTSMDLHTRGQGLAIVVMGVSGSGKSTVAEMLAKSLSCSYLEGDDFLTKASIGKMSNGTPFSEADRIPWLEAIREAIMKNMNQGETVTVTCSALQKKYREILRSADPNYKPSDYMNCTVKFVLLEAPMEVIADRIERRFKDGKHFLPVTLLQYQLDLLQIDEAEGITKVDTTISLEAVVDTITAVLERKLSCM